MTGEARSAVLGTLGVSGAQILVGAMFALASLYLVRSLPTDEYGRIAFAIYVYTLLQALANLGLSTGVLAEVAQGRAGSGIAWPTVHALLRIRVLTIVPVVAVGLVWSVASQDVLPIMASVTAGVAIAAEFLIGILAGQLRTRAYVTLVLLQPSGYLVLLLLLQVGTAELGLIALGVGLAASLLFGVALVGRGPRSPDRPPASLAELGHSISVARSAYLFGAIHIGFVSVPVIALGALGRYVEAAGLSIVLTLARFAPEALGLAVVSTYLPRLKAIDPLGQAATRLFGTFARILTVLALPAAVALASSGRAILGVLFAGRYDQLAPYVAIASVLAILLPAESLLTWTLVSRGDVRFAIGAAAVRLAAVLVASAIALSAQDPLLIVLGAAAVGAMASVALMAGRAGRRLLGAALARSMLVYALVTLGAFGLLRALTASMPDVAILLLTGMTAVLLLGVGAWLMRVRPPAAAEGGRA